MKEGRSYMSLYYDHFKFYSCVCPLCVGFRRKKKRILTSEAATKEPSGEVGWFVRKPVVITHMLHVWHEIFTYKTGSWTWGKCWDSYSSTMVRIWEITIGGASKWWQLVGSKTSNLQPSDPRMFLVSDHPIQGWYGLGSTEKVDFFHNRAEKIDSGQEIQFR